MVERISCGLLVLVLCEGLSGWGQGLGRCCRSGSGWVCDFGFNVVLLVCFLYGDGLRQVGVGCTPTMSWLVAGEGGAGLGWGGTVCVSFYVLGAFFVLLVSELRFVWLFLQYQW